jgi:prepilin-type N-terminal cleavage/methylation domain-containing protein
MNRKWKGSLPISRWFLKPTTVAYSSGFTLIEIIVAIFILTIGILAVSQMTVLGMRTSQIIKNRGESKEVLAKGLEVIKVMTTTDPQLTPSCDSTTLSDTTLAYVANPGNAVGQAIGVTSFNVYWNVAADYPTAGHLTIRMLVFNNRSLLASADFVKWR